jgi:hypothetical protein
MGDEERRAANLSLLNDLLDRTARIEERGKMRKEWEDRTEGRLEKIEAGQSTTNKKLDEVIAEIRTAKAVGKFGGRFIGWFFEKIPGASIAAGIGYAAHFIWPSK